VHVWKRLVVKRSFSNSTASKVLKQGK
jgi:hypothetical protein